MHACMHVGLIWRLYDKGLVQIADAKLEFWDFLRPLQPQGHHHRLGDDGRGRPDHLGGFEGRYDV